MHKVVPTADRAKANVLTKIRFVEYDSRVLPEMSAKISFLNENDTAKTNADAQPILTVRQEAIVERDGNKVAFLLRNETVEEITVQLGQTMGSMYEVIAGLSANDKVVVRPDEKLKSGTKIKVKE